MDMHTTRKIPNWVYFLGALIGVSALSEIGESKISSHSILYRMWRIVFFPIAILCVIIVLGLKGLISFIALGIIIVAAQFISLPKRL